MLVILCWPCCSYGTAAKSSAAWEASNTTCYSTLRSISWSVSSRFWAIWQMQPTRPTPATCVSSKNAWTKSTNQRTFCAVKRNKGDHGTQGERTMSVASLRLLQRCTRNLAIAKATETSLILPTTEMDTASLGDHRRLGHLPRPEVARRQIGIGAKNTLADPDASGLMMKRWEYNNLACQGVSKKSYV